MNWQDIDLLSELIFRIVCGRGHSKRTDSWLPGFRGDMSPVPSSHLGRLSMCPVTPLLYK